MLILFCFIIIVAVLLLGLVLITIFSGRSFRLLKKMTVLKRIAFIGCLLAILLIRFFYISAVGSDPSVDLRNEGLGVLKIRQKFEQNYQFVRDFSITGEDGTIAFHEKGKTDPDLRVTVDKKKRIVALFHTSEEKNIKRLKEFK
ncbi:hypothetical protein PJ311_09340 [Bacillus sp. CLL-7-23]|uniref:Uncharacterized protein n=1 Tax=Bacillus changyiensis TaxID=3004103 RepID=A0ABT4X3D1_9BACI|nr:hypothetical protein [Bacillus changyiensis]MDA7026809.1 hypothetical protein [Bacillus changyiensis]